MICSICNKEIKDLSYTTTIEDGKHYHTECYNNELKKIPKIEYGYLRDKAKNKRRKK